MIKQEAEALVEEAQQYLGRTAKFLISTKKGKRRVECTFVKIDPLVGEGEEKEEKTYRAYGWLRTNDTQEMKRSSLREIVKVFRAQELESKKSDSDESKSS